VRAVGAPDADERGAAGDYSGSDVEGHGSSWLHARGMRVEATKKACLWARVDSRRGVPWVALRARGG
jgi:hypothetical protein